MDSKEQALPENKRFAPRRARRLPAMFYADGVSGGVRCVIVDLSSTGARVQVERGLLEGVLRQAGREFKRIRLVELKEKVSYDCWIVRHDEREMGLRFAAPPQLPPVPASRPQK